MLLNLMKSLIKNEFKEFVLCLGYKKEDIEKYFFNNYKIYLKKIVNKKYKKITIKLRKVKIIIHLVDTEKNSGTGGRIKIANQIVKNKADFFCMFLVFNHSFTYFRNRAKFLKSE